MSGFDEIRDEDPFCGVVNGFIIMFTIGVLTTVAYLAFQGTKQGTEAPENCLSATTSTTTTTQHSDKK